MFVNLANDPFHDRLIVGIYGTAGSGKSTLALDLAKAGECVYLFSFDYGYGRAAKDPSKYKRLLPIVIEGTPEEVVRDAAEGCPPSFTRTLYRRMAEVVEVRIPALMAKGVPASSIWIVLDTVSHMQSRLLHEGQMEQIRQGANTTFRAGKGDDGRAGKLPEWVRSELLTTPEWGANLSIMGGIADFLMQSKANLLYLFLEKGDRNVKDQVRVVPAVQGASYQRYTGDVDVLLWLSAAADGRGRVLRSQSTSKWEAKDRYGRLPEKIECDGSTVLVGIRKTSLKREGE